MQSKWLGLLSYQEALDFQEKTYNEVLNSGDSCILGLEHKPVVSLGLRSDPEKDLCWDKEQYLKQNIEIHHSPRGGEATLHAPGQLVIYPIINLKRRGLGAKDYVSRLMSHTQGKLASLGVQCQEQSGEPGLYTDKGKIVFAGLKISKGVSSHGISINVSNNLELFKSIRSCGRFSESFDRISDYSQLNCKDLFELWAENFL